MPNEQRPVPSGGEMYRAGRPAPGARLLAAASLLQGGGVVADIGCDHGKLAVYLVLRGLCPRVVAVDARPLPLARAAALAKQCGVAQKVDCRLGDGLAPLAPGEADEILIAGLSGETIAEILGRAPWLAESDARLVLQPTSRAPLLRRWLCRHGFVLLREKPVAERGRAYTNILAQAGGVPGEPDELFCEMGLLPAAAEKKAAAQLLGSRLADMKNQLKAPLAPDEIQALKALMNEVERCRNCMK